MTTSNPVLVRDMLRTVAANLNHLCLILATEGPEALPTEERERVVAEVERFLGLPIPHGAPEMVTALRAAVAAGDDDHDFELLAKLKVILAQPQPRPGTPEALALLHWSRHDKPGQRVLTLAAQGFHGCGRNDAAAAMQAAADRCTSDAEAMEILRDFRWNYLADLPFPIRELLGFDADGNETDEHGNPVSR